VRRFRVLRDEMFDASAQLNGLSKNVLRIAESSMMIAREMKSSNQSYSEVASAIDSVGNDSLFDSDCIKALSNGLENVAESYEITEKQVAN